MHRFKTYTKLLCISVLALSLLTSCKEKPIETTTTLSTEDDYNAKVQAAYFHYADAPLDIAESILSRRYKEDTPIKYWYWLASRGENNAFPRIAGNTATLHFSASSWLKDYFNKQDLIKIDSAPFNISNIPDESIIKVEKMLFSNDSTWLQNYTTACIVNDISKLNIKYDDNTSDFSNNTYYLADYDKDNIEELISINPGGSMGNASLYYGEKDADGVYNMVYRFQIPLNVEIVKFGDDVFVALKSTNLTDWSLNSVTLISFKNPEKESAATISFSNEISTRYEFKTYMPANNHKELVNKVTANITQLLKSSAAYPKNPYEIYGNENLQSVNIDMDNDGKDEKLDRNIWLTSSINSVNNLQVTVKSQKDKALPLENFLPEEALISSNTILQFYTENYNNQNYIVMLQNHARTKNYNVAIYLCNKDGKKLISNEMIILFQNINVTTSQYEEGGYF